jgi:rubrerythrin
VESIARKECNKLLQSKRRAIEPISDALKRKENDRLAKEHKKKLESVSEQLSRKENNRLSQSNKRASESNDAAYRRKAANAAAKKDKVMSIDEAIKTFLEKIKKGPVYVCTVCHRLMYKESVCLLHKDKYVKASAEVLACVFNKKFEYISVDHKMWVCRNCDKALLRGNIPLQSKANGFSLPEVPPELSSLNMLERRLISLRIPFMKMVALPVGKQRRIHGPAINVLSNLDSVCTVLPRLPSESELIPLKLSLFQLMLSN